MAGEIIFIGISDETKNEEIIDLCCSRGRSKNHTNKRNTHRTQRQKLWFVAFHAHQRIMAAPLCD